jgi:hypothetical protein
VATASNRNCFKALKDMPKPDEHAVIWDLGLEEEEPESVAPTETLPDCGREESQRRETEKCTRDAAEITAREAREQAREQERQRVELERRQTLDAAHQEQEAARLAAAEHQRREAVEQERREEQARLQRERDEQQRRREEAERQESLRRAEQTRLETQREEQARREMPLATTPFPGFPNPLSPPATKSPFGGALPGMVTPEEPRKSLSAASYIPPLFRAAINVPAEVASTPPDQKETILPVAPVLLSANEKPADSAVPLPPPTRKKPPLLGPAFARADAPPAGQEEKHPD